MPFSDFFHKKKVLVTGNTGFKGSWLSLWLRHLGADVSGLALAPNTTPSAFEILQLVREVAHHTLDIRNAEAVADLVAALQPDVIFHLAAQPLVRLSYQIPVDTVATNILGTAHLLQGIRAAGYSAEKPCSVVIVTSDKCYENREVLYGYREEDPMGGHDIYSMSKGAAELLVSSWRRSFFPHDAWCDHGVSLITARAGNVIGGGDWSADRIVVDCVKALADGSPIQVRNPVAVRPWQHVLEPLSGYLQLAAETGRARGTRPELMSAYNFGPGRDSERNVGELVAELIAQWGSGTWQHHREYNPVHEATYLKLCTDKAWHELGWQPVWGFTESIRRTVAWYKTASVSNCSSEKMYGLTRTQIDGFTEAAEALGLRWAA